MSQLTRALLQVQINLRAAISDTRAAVAGTGAATADIAKGSADLSGRTESQADALQKTVADVFVRLAPGSAPGAGVPADVARVELTDCTFAPRVQGVVTGQTNSRSARVLEKLGFGREGLIQLPGDPEDLLLFSSTAPAAYNREP